MPTQVGERLFLVQIDLPPQERPKWYHLPGTGFDVKKQVAQLQTDIQFGLKHGLNYEKNIEGWFNKIRGDVYGFSLEYLKGQAFLPFEQVIEPYQGRDRVKPNNYGDRPMVDLIDDQERNGAVKKGLGDVENFLLQAPVGAMVVRTSPPGRTDLYYQTADGLKEVVYQDTQTQIYEKISDKQIRSYTIRTGKEQMDVEKNQKLLEFLGVSQMRLNQWQTEKERLALISGTNAYLLPGQINTEQIIEKMRELTGDRAFGDVSFDQVLWGLNHFDEIIRIDEQTLAHTNEFIAKAKEILTNYYHEVIANQGLSDELTDQIEFELGRAILDLSDASERILLTAQPDYLNYTSTPVDYSQPSITPPPDHSHYQQSLTKLQSKPGCAGGGESASTQTESPIYSQPTVFGPRSASLEKPSSLDSNEKNSCSHCGAKDDGHYHCPDCNNRFEDESNKPMSEWTPYCKCGFEFACAAEQKKQL